MVCKSINKKYSLKRGKREEEKGCQALFYAIGGFGLSIFDKAFIISLILFLPFLFLSFGIVLAYLKLNRLEMMIKDLEKRVSGTLLKLFFKKGVRHSFETFLNFSLQ
jgi:hypothetical protein